MSRGQFVGGDVDLLRQPNILKGISCRLIDVGAGRSHLPLPGLPATADRRPAWRSGAVQRVNSYALNQTTALLAYV
ncbi:hypothetical protein CRI77_10430 [Mycolicibacterium duvalii]|nr:hypothetical protein CRI77_10430 [Mycolicibacterium duvalii]